MRRRIAIMLIAIVAFIAAIGFIKYRQIRTAMAQGASFKPPPESVTTSIARSETWPSTIATIGTVTAVQGVLVSADLPGQVEAILFQSGRPVRRGDVLVRQDTRQEQAQLASATAARDLAKLEYDRSRTLVQQAVISASEADQKAAAFKQAEAQVGEIRATIDRKHIRAPFNGEAGIRMVNVGQYLASGAPIVPVQTLDPIYVEFGVPQQEVTNLRLGGQVKLAAESLAAVATGRITAINSVVDPATRNVEVQATFANPHRLLRPGMFVDLEVRTGTAMTVIALPATAINYAPYGNSVFVVETMRGPDGKPYRGARQQFVKLGGSRGDLVAVTSGLQAGQEIVTSGAFKLRNGAAVTVNNRVRPPASPNPRPEES
jgi:membrane fusion protein, multidrug efflux system